MLRVLADVRLLADDGSLQPGWIQIDGEQIVATGFGDALPPIGIDRETQSGAIALPGFIDVHCHGGGGASYLSGSTGEARRAAKAHLRRGTTTTLASLASAPLSALREQIVALIPLVDDGTIHGVHLEGPWLAPSMRGAHDRAVLRALDLTELDDLLELAGGRIRMVTVAPEVVGVDAAIARIVAAGAVVAIGHTAADAEHIALSIAAGASVATHLFNAMPPLQHRQPGPVGVLLDDRRVIIELIADLEHVDPLVLRIAMRAAGVDRVALITDAIAAADAGDGDWQFADQAVVVVGGVARLRDGGALAGSTLTQDVALRNVVERVGVTLAEASQMLSATPARVLGLADRGALAAGQRADIVLLDDRLQVQRVLRGGGDVIS